MSSHKKPTAAAGYPHEIIDCDQATNERLRKFQPLGMAEGCMMVGKDRYFYPKNPVERLESLYNYPLDARDTWVVTMPKCGTTWTQEMVWLIANDCDFEAAKAYLIPDRWNFLEMTHKLLAPDSAGKTLFWNAVKSGPWKAPRALWLSMKLMWPRNYRSPRFIKSHAPFSMLPPALLDTCKVVYVARNPKDAMVSYYHHHRLMKVQGFEGSFEEFFELFLEDKLLQLPFMPHVLEAWEKKDHPNLLFLFFEEMKADLRGVIRRVGTFLGKTLTEEQVEQLYEHLKFDNFKKNPYVNFDILKELGGLTETENFIRKGKTGDWKNYFSPEMDARMNAWIEERLKGSSLTFQMELKHQD